MAASSPLKKAANNSVHFFKKGEDENPPLENGGMGGFVTGTAWGIDEQGALLLQVGNQRLRYVYGEVSLRLWAHG